MLVAALLLSCGGCESADPEPYTVEMTGRDFHWTVRYPGEDGRLHTADDRLGDSELHLPSQSPVRIRLKSADYVYTLDLPDLGLREMAVPDVEFSLNFRTGQPATLRLRGDQMCGYAHATLFGELIVEPRAQLDAWLARPK
ncbi:MAG: cytochrome c oxidase subunit 2 [Myxococcota bacterium]